MLAKSSAEGGSYAAALCLHKSSCITAFFPNPPQKQK
jgi:hypothetical protein